MAQKRLLGGMLVLVLAFGMMVVGCGGSDPYVVKITNGTNFTVSLVILERGSTVYISDPAGISSGTTKTYEFDDGFPSRVKLTVRVGLEEVEVTGSASGSVGNGERTNYVLSGTSKETLKISG